MYDVCWSEIPTVSPVKAIYRSKKESLGIKKCYKIIS